MGVSVGVVSGSETERLFRVSRDPLMTSLWSTMVSAWPSAFVHSNQAGIQRAMHEDYAFISDAPKLEFAAFQEPCVFYKTNNFLPKQHYAFVVNRRDRELKQILDETLFHMNANGELGELKDKWWVNNCRNATRRARVRNRQELQNDEVLLENTSPRPHPLTDAIKITLNEHIEDRSHASLFQVSVFCKVLIFIVFFFRL